LSVPVRATLRQDCDESRPKVDRLLIRPTHGDRAGAGSKNGQVPLRAPGKGRSVCGSRSCHQHQPWAPPRGTGGPQTHSQFESRSTMTACARGAAGGGGRACRSGLWAGSRRVSHRRIRVPHRRGFGLCHARGCEPREFEGCYRFRPEDLALFKVGSCIEAAIPDARERLPAPLRSVEVLDRKCRSIE